MSMATDIMMGVREGALPNPATALNLLFALVYTLIVLNELHLVLNHEIDGLPSILPNALSNFLMDCHLLAVQSVSENSLSTNPVILDKVFESRLKSISVLMTCVALPIYRNAWDSVAEGEQRKGQVVTMVGDIVFFLNNDRDIAISVGGVFYESLYSVTYFKDAVVVLSIHDLM
jgi:hypothetical protein